MKYITLILLICSALSVVNCSTDLVVLKTNCAELNWFERGRQDGMQGQPSNNWTMTSKACSNMNQAEILQYMDGWNKGLSMFCTEEHGFIMAKSGLSYKKTCPEKYEEAFLKGYQKGLQVFLIEKETNQIIAQIEGMEEQLHNSKVPDQDKAKIERAMNQLNERKLVNIQALEKFNSTFTQ